MPIDMNTRQPGQDIGQDASIMDFLRAMGQDAGAVGSKVAGLFTGNGQPVAAKGIQADPAAVANKSMRQGPPQMPVGNASPAPGPVSSAELPSIKPPTAATPQQGAATTAQGQLPPAFMQLFQKLIMNGQQSSAPNNGALSPIAAIMANRRAPSDTSSNRRGMLPESYK